MHCHRFDRKIVWDAETACALKFKRSKTFDVAKDRIMFPTTHDITPALLGHCLKTLDTLIVKRGLRVLIVSKPHMECITAICERFAAHKAQILFRFTIGSDDDRLLADWEPGAPSFAERIACLEYAQRQGFATSVSCEPMLDPPHIARLVDRLAPLVTDAIWIGKANGLSAQMRISEPKHVVMMATLEEQQLPERIEEIYESLKGHPLVKWKESIKEIMGLEVATEAGLDM
jgi:DNA repair photolyase